MKKTVIFLGQLGLCLVGFLSVFFVLSIYAKGMSNVTVYSTERRNYKNVELGIADDEDTLDSVIDKYDVSKGVQLGLLTKNTVLTNTVIPSVVEPTTKYGFGLDVYGDFTKVTSFEDVTDYSWILTNGNFIEDIDDNVIIHKPTCIIVTSTDIYLVSADGDYTKIELMQLGTSIADKYPVNQDNKYLYMYVVEKSDRVETVMMLRD